MPLLLRGQGRCLRPLSASRASGAAPANRQNHERSSFPGFNVVPCASTSSFRSSLASVTLFGGTDMKQVARLLMAALTLTGCAQKSVIQEETDEFVGKPTSEDDHGDCGHPSSARRDRYHVCGSRHVCARLHPRASHRGKDLRCCQNRRARRNRLIVVVLADAGVPSYRVPGPQRWQSGFASSRGQLGGLAMDVPLTNVFSRTNREGSAARFLGWPARR
jgi:hypothetical protein